MIRPGRNVNAPATINAPNTSDRMVARCAFTRRLRAARTPITRLYSEMIDRIWIGPNGPIQRMSLIQKLLIATVAIANTQHPMIAAAFAQRKDQNRQRDSRKCSKNVA